MLTEDELGRVMADHRETWRPVESDEVLEIGLTEERRETPRMHVARSAERIEHVVEVVHHTEAVHAVAHPLRLVDADVQRLLHVAPSSTLFAISKSFLIFRPP